MSRSTAHDTPHDTPHDALRVPRSIAGLVTEKLRAEILRGYLAPGARLSIKDLSDRLDVSLSPLREALTRLGAEGLLHADEQRGYWVTPISDRDLGEVTTLRIEFEKLALRDAVAKGSIEWETRTMAALYRMNRIERIAGDAGTLETWETAHQQFHLALLSAAEMPLLLNFIAILHRRSDRYRRLFLASNPPDRNSAEEHVRIAHAAVARNADDAAELLAAHIERTGTAVRKRLLAAGDVATGAMTR
jgi:DNA-binding GntR family transcriptional regulator